MRGLGALTVSARVCVCVCVGFRVVCIVSKVCEGHDAALSGLPAESSSSKAEKKPLAGSVVNQRHLAFVNRGRVAGESWRPKKVYRVAAKHWLANLDCQLRHSTATLGLKSFKFDKESFDQNGPPVYTQPMQNRFPHVECSLNVCSLHSHRFFTPKDSPIWSDAMYASWPCLVGALDQGSDGLCASFAMEYNFGLNFHRYCDFSHGVHKDLQVGLKSAGLWNYTLLVMIHTNLLHGPCKDDQRYHQVRDAMKAAYRCLDHTNPLFASLVPSMFDELKAGGIELPGVDAPEKEIWCHLAKADPFSRKGDKLNLCRFMGILKSAEESILPRWSVDAWERTFVALECDMLKGKVAQPVLYVVTSRSNQHV